MSQQDLPLTHNREAFVDILPGDRSASGLLELHFRDAQGRPSSYLILPEKAQHELLNALLWERRHDIANPGYLARLEEKL